MINNKLYEGMFLVDTAKAAADWDGVINSISMILQKVGSEIISIRKWDERKLAYSIKGQTRGTYILCYFRVDSQKIHEIELAVRLSEQIIRVLILNAEHMTTEDIEKDTPATKTEKDTKDSAARDKGDDKSDNLKDDSDQNDENDDIKDDDTKNDDTNDNDEQLQENKDEPDEDSDKPQLQAVEEDLEQDQAEKD